MSKTIYIADDEESIRRIISSFLKKAGYEVRCFEDGEQLFRAFEAAPPDLLILDVMMPGLDGLSLCAMIRRVSAIPIVIVSAKDSELDRVTGITLGSDDYLVKPFSPLELVARVKALFRRAGLSGDQAAPGTLSPAGAEPVPPPQEELCYGDVLLDLKLRTARAHGKPFSVTPTEFDFLAYLMQNSDRAVSKAELLKSLWRFDYETDNRATDDIVKRLRKKLREQRSAVRIETVWGFGYRLAQEEEGL